MSEVYIFERKKKEILNYVFYYLNNLINELIYGKLI